MAPTQPDARGGAAHALGAQFRQGETSATQFEDGPNKRREGLRSNLPQEGTGERDRKLGKLKSGERFTALLLHSFVSR